MNRLTKKIGLVLISSSLILSGCEPLPPERAQRDDEQHPPLLAERDDEQNPPGVVSGSGAPAVSSTGNSSSGYHSTFHNSSPGFTHGISPVIVPFGGGQPGASMGSSGGAASFASAAHAGGSARGGFGGSAHGGGS